MEGKYLGDCSFYAKNEVEETLCHCEPLNLRGWFLLIELNGNAH